MDADQAQRVAAARLRTTLLAERAFGARDVLDYVPPELPPVVDEVASEPVRRQPKRPTPSPRERTVPVAARPTIDLFGNPTVAAETPEVEPLAGEALPRKKRIELLAALDADEVTGCKKCDLCQNRTHTVFGEGDPEAELMFIGEGPGENEDLSGRPFVGKAGDLLNKMILGMKLRREDVYIANVVKCRPPGNRTPAAHEIATCTPYLHRQVELIRPKVLVTLGLPATRHLLGLKLPMSKMRGEWHAWRGVRVMPTYHPAYLLRSYTQANRAAVWSDLQEVMRELSDDAA
jgi:DNA polymerase